MLFRFARVADDRAISTYAAALCSIRRIGYRGSLPLDTLSRDYVVDLLRDSELDVHGSAPRAESIRFGLDWNLRHEWLTTALNEDGAPTALTRTDPQRSKLDRYFRFAYAAAEELPSTGGNPRALYAKVATTVHDGGYGGVLRTRGREAYLASLRRLYHRHAKTAPRAKAMLEAMALLEALRLCEWRGTELRVPALFRQERGTFVFRAEVTAEVTA